MPSILILAVLIECLLIFMTTVFLIQPQFFFRALPSRIHSVAYGVGMMSLCLTFCWSVVLGILLNLNGLSLRV